MSINHEAAALDYIAAANTTADTLDELLEARHVTDRNARMAEAHRRIGHALKLAHIHATLALAQAQQPLVPLTPAFELVEFPAATS